MKEDGDREWGAWMMYAQAAAHNEYKIPADFTHNPMYMILYSTVEIKGPTWHHGNQRRGLPRRSLAGNVNSGDLISPRDPSLGLWMSVSNMCHGNPIITSCHYRKSQVISLPSLGSMNFYKNVIAICTVAVEVYQSGSADQLTHQHDSLYHTVCDLHVHWSNTSKCRPKQITPSRGWLESSKRMHSIKLNLITLI